jgi:hypothetical protein
MRYVSTCVGARVVGVGKQWTKAIRCSACYFSIVVNAHRVTSMADTDIDAVRKQKKAEVYTYSCSAYRFYAYRLYVINVWHVYEWPKTYTWSGTFILKEGRYTFFFLYIFSTCLGYLCAHHQEKLLYLCDTWYLSLCVDDCLVCRILHGWVETQFQLIHHTSREQIGWIIPDAVNSQVLLVMGENIARNM